LNQISFVQSLCYSELPCGELNACNIWALVAGKFVLGFVYEFA